MLKRVPKDQIRAGMWVESIEGWWFLHPFWAAKFLISSDDAAIFRASRIKAIIIDTEKGTDLALPAGQPVQPSAQPSTAIRPAALAKARVYTPPPAKSAKAAVPAKCDSAAEMARASKIVRRSRKVMSQLFDQARLGKVVETGKLEDLVSDIAQSVSRNRSALASILRLKTKDEYTYMHSVAVAALMVNLARELGFSDSQVRQAGIAGLLHDVGKMAVADNVLNKAGSLTDEELAEVRTHPERGHALLLQSGDVPAAALDVCLHHHEKIDGTGYPRGLSGEDISLLARMGAICDVYDAITSDRPYKKPWSAAESIGKMRGWKGHFDEKLFEAFVRTVGIYPVGSLVQLVSGRLAVVTDIDRAHPTSPKVRVFLSAQGEALAPDDLDLSESGEEIAAAVKPNEWGFENWESFWPALLKAPRTKTVVLPSSNPEMADSPTSPASVQLSKVA
jgi:putative nucleotidyltransferase with HDIG domain